MRRLNVGIIPAILLATAFGSAEAQTRTAPSIGDVVRQSSGRVTTRPGVSVRGVPLPDQRCQDSRGSYRYDGRYDRDNGYDRDRMDRERRERAFDRDRNGRLDAQERKELEKELDKARKQAAKNDRKDDRDDRYDRDRDDDRDGRFGCCTDGRYDTDNRDPRTSGSRNSGTGTIEARRGTNGGVYNGGNHNGSGRVSQNDSRNNGCGVHNGNHNQNRNQRDRR